MSIGKILGGIFGGGGGEQQQQPYLPHQQVGMKAIGDASGNNKADAPGGGGI